MLKKAILSIPLLCLQLQAMAVSVIIGVNQQPLCTYSTGSLSAGVSGGVGPYAYLWSNGATSSSIDDVPAGYYSVTVTDGNSDQAFADVDLVAINYSESNYANQGIRPYCSGVFPDASFMLVTPELSIVPWGPQPYYLDGQYMNQVNPAGYETFMATIPGTPGVPYYATFQDGTGCSGQWLVTPVAAIEWPVLGIMDIQGSCSNFATGVVSIAHTAGNSQYYINATLENLTTQTMLFGPGGSMGYMDYFGSPSGTLLLNNLPPGDYRMRQRIIGLWDSEECYDELLFTIPDLGPTCGKVRGQAFVDYNRNCTNQSNEPGAPAQVLEVLPGPYYTSTGGSGLYSMVLPLGAYTLTQQSSTLAEHCTGGPIAFTIATSPNTVTRNLPDTSLVGLDVQTSLSSGAARPGFEFQYAINVRNLTPSLSGATSLTFTFDPAVGYLSATPTPSSVVGNVITWNQAQLTAWQQRNYTIHFQVPPDIDLLGYELQATATVSTTNTDGNTTNNTATNLRTITGAYDPNDKLAVTSSGNTSMWQINEDEWIDYTIRFQNTGTDTAFHVVITDTLPDNLDPGSITVGAASHAFTWQLRDQGTLKFYFSSILLPDSNVNEPRSHGFVGFRIKPVLPLLPGTIIENIANIYFDFNEPVLTEPSVLVAEFSTGIDVRTTSAFNAYPVPATDHVRVHWPTGTNVNSTWTMFAMDGRAVLHGRTTASEEILDIANLAKGSYVLRLLTNDRSHSVNLLISQHP